jgi:hypothetical protein
MSKINWNSQRLVTKNLNLVLDVLELEVAMKEITVQKWRQWRM